MKNKDIIKLLRTVDEETAVQLCEEYHGISEKDHGRLRKKVRNILSEQDLSEYEYFAEKVTVKNSKFGWISKTATAAAYVSFFGGLLAGVLNMNVIEPDETQQELSDAPSFTTETRYSAKNMVSAGNLIVDVEKAEFAAKGEYQLTLEITSENAVSLNGTRVFLADNFMAAFTSENGIERVIPPCAISEAGERYAYAFTLEDGENCILTLKYSLDTVPDALVSGHSEKSFFIKLTED